MSDIKTIQVAESTLSIGLIDLANQQKLLQRLIHADKPQHLSTGDRQNLEGLEELLSAILWSYKKPKKFLNSETMYKGKN